MSGLYFRGKLAYARSFARPLAGADGISGDHAVPGAALAGCPGRTATLQRYGAIEIDPSDPRYRRPLVRDARALAAA